MTEKKELGFKSIIVILLICVTFSYFITMFYYSNIVFYNTVELRRSEICYEEEVFLLKQFFNESYCNNCLQFETLKNGKIQKYYFATEFEKNENIKENSTIKLNWCYIPQIDGFRIRGIS